MKCMEKIKGCLGRKTHVKQTIISLYIPFIVVHLHVQFLWTCSCKFA